VKDDLKNAEQEEFSVAEETSDMTPRFRSIKTGSQRRGIRMEQIYWDTLQAISQHEGMTLARYIGDVADRFPDALNITSVLRVLAAAWLRDRNRELRQLTSLNRVDALVKACPSPAFALQENKQIVSYNSAFLHFVHSRLSYSPQGVTAKSLRLSLDVHITELAEALRRADNKPLRTGFVLGIDEKRLRGQLTTTLAPVSDKVTILGYVLPGQG
jgi:predicted DNA-binding ribbon-helix-helix protein